MFAVFCNLIYFWKPYWWSINLFRWWTYTNCLVKSRPNSFILVVASAVMVPRSARTCIKSFRVPLFLHSSWSRGQLLFNDSISWWPLLPKSWSPFNKSVVAAEKSFPNSWAIFDFKDLWSSFAVSLAWGAPEKLQCQPWRPKFFEIVCKANFGAGFVHGRSRYILGDF